VTLPTETTAAEPGTIAKKWSRRQSWIAVAVALAGLVAVFAWWRHASRQAAERELAAKTELAELGALVVMDVERKHVSSVNLSTLKSPDTLDRAVALLPELTRLQSLHVEGTGFRDEHISVVGRLARLQDLALSNTQITDAALDKLQGLSRLNTIYLVDTALTNAGMPALARIRSLKIIDISATKVTGNFAPLCELPDLGHLLARELALDATALAALAECPALTRLSLQDSTYPQASLDELMQKRPELAIDR
jgi:hypothetical protein